VIKMGFWPGGDRDGNPFVKSETTLRVAEALRGAIIRCYYFDVRRLKRRLTFKGVDVLLAELEQKLYNNIFVPNQRTDLSKGEMLDVLNQIKEIIIYQHNGLFVDKVDNLIGKVMIFGLHFATLDIRQESSVHGNVLKAIAAREQLLPAGYEGMSDAEKIAVLPTLKGKAQPELYEDPLIRDTIESVGAMRTIQGLNGENGCSRYIISQCSSAVNVMEVMGLLLVGGFPKDSLTVDIVPLFETVDDLKAAASVMEELYSNSAYRKHLKKRGDVQTIMLGFSDGTKDGGYLMANWAIYKAKEELTAISTAYGVDVVFFDGRGGPPARGGGNTHDFYASLGNTIEKEQVQITIQGQTISSNFGKLASCKYNLEQLLSAGIMSNVFDSDENNLSEESKQLLDELADEGYKSYLGLKNHPKFVPYLERITPLAFFGDTNVGSRPVKRSASEGLKFEDLRAIPFVGSWAMMKQNIPGFFGVGSAIEAMEKKGKGEKLKELYKNSLFFRTLLSNSMMSLTKTNFQATKYLHDDPEFGPFWDIMNNEYELSIKKLLEISGLPDLMNNNPMIKSSVGLREKIVLPLIVIQQYALMNLRNLREEDKQFEQYYRRLIMRCMFGIINAARNSA